jgi:hypothetical protein
LPAAVATVNLRDVRELDGVHLPTISTTEDTEDAERNHLTSGGHEGTKVTKKFITTLF